VQYAASGVPVLALSNGPCASFPEATATDRGDLIARAEALLSDRNLRLELSEATHRRFEQSFSADSRARALIALLTLGDAWRDWSLERRARFFMDPPQMPDAPSPQPVGQNGSPRLDGQRRAAAVFPSGDAGLWVQIQKQARRVGALAVARTANSGSSRAGRGQLRMPHGHGDFACCVASRTCGTRATDRRHAGRGNRSRGMGLRAAAPARSRRVAMAFS